MEIVNDKQDRVGNLVDENSLIERNDTNDDLDLRNVVAGDFSKVT